MFIPIPIILFIAIIYLNATTKTNSSVVKIIKTGTDNFSKLPKEKQMIQIAKIMLVITMTITLSFASVHTFNSMYKTFDTSVSNVIKTQR